MISATKVKFIFISELMIDKNMAMNRKIRLCLNYIINFMSYKTKLESKYIERIISL